MRKREQREEKRIREEAQRKKVVTRNWIIAVVALGLALLSYGFNDIISGFLSSR